MTHSLSTSEADRPPAMYRSATLAIVVSSTSMKVGMTTATATIQGVIAGRPAAAAAATQGLVPGRPAAAGAGAGAVPLMGRAPTGPGRATGPRPSGRGARG